MARVTDPIHKSKRRVRERTIARVILDNNSSLTNPCSFRKENSRVSCMMKHITEQYDVEAIICIRESFSIKRGYRNFRPLTYQKVNSLNLDIRPLLHYQPGQFTVAASHI